MRGWVGRGERVQSVEIESFRDFELASSFQRKFQEKVSQGFDKFQKVSESFKKTGQS